MTHQEIADEMGISKARVGQLEASGLRKLREAFGTDCGLSAAHFLDIKPPPIDRGARG